MPAKRNPTDSEFVNGLCRIVARLAPVAWDNAALTFLERTLDDAAGRNFIWPSLFIAIDEALLRCGCIVRGLVVDQRAVARNLAAYDAFSSTERLLMLGVSRGANRQELHEHLRMLCAATREQERGGERVRLLNVLRNDPRLREFITSSEIDALMQGSDYTGAAKELALELAEHVGQQLASAT